MDSHTISIHTEYTAKDFYTAHMYVSRRRTILVFLILVFCYGSFAGILFYEGGMPMLREFMAPALPYGVGLLVLSSLGTFLGPYLSIRHYLKKARIFQGRICLNLSKDSVELVTPTYTSRTDWSNIVSAVETPGYLLLYVSAGSVHLIPKHDVDDTETLVQIRRLIRENVKGKVKLLAT
ncbi:MAG TPA: YcxB family protein [Candidatus Acidoferrum sp.]|nr:YcxB family protein [Candidatus Acidoferrum sp.]